MDNDKLPLELAELEQRLVARPCPEPAAGLRRRVLGAVARELEQPAAPRLSWTTMAVPAAAVLLWINLSMSAVNHTDWHFGSRTDRATFAASATRLRTLFPEMSEGEAYRQALLLEAGAYLTPAPDVQPRPRPLSY
jgi:hypothetical protein